MKTTRTLAAIAAAALPTIAMAGTISTALPNNGSGGVFTDLTSLGAALTVTSFEVPLSGTVGNAVNVEVWTRSGSYVGNTASNAGWTLSETVVGIAGGTSFWVPLSLASPISIGAGGTTAVYLHATTSGGGIRYTGTSASPPQTTWSNADISLFSDVSRTGAIPFAGTQFTPRTFSGVVNYDVVPAPASLALIGLGGLVANRRRR